MGQRIAFSPLAQHQGNIRTHQHVLGVQAQTRNQKIKTTRRPAGHANQTDKGRAGFGQGSKRTGAAMRENLLGQQTPLIIEGQNRCSVLVIR